MKKKYSRILGVALSLMLVASLFGFAAPVSADDVAWSSIANPSALSTSMNLADVEVGPIAVTPDGGTIFAAVNCEATLIGLGTANAFSLPDINDQVTLTAGAAGATISWVVTAGTIAEGATGTVTLAPAATQTFTATAITTTGTWIVSSGVVTPTITVDGDADATCSGVALTAAGTPWALVQSNNGYTWTVTGLINQPAVITGIAISSNFATDGTMYVASGVTVFRSTDSGVTFIALKPILDSGGTPITVINSIAMWAGTPAYVMIGTDLDVLVLADSVFEDWRDQELGNPLAAVAVAFAPDFATSNYIWAITAAGVASTTNSPGAWGTLLANTPVLSAAVNACIAFPDPASYSSATAPYLWVGIDSGPGANTGGIWRVRGLPIPGPSQIVPQYGAAVAVPPAAAACDVRSLAASGLMATATLIVGLQDSPLVVKSINGGVTWPPQVFKQPTGGGAVFVVMAPNFATSNEAYLGTSDGATTESAFQMSADGGMSWSQTGLIDTPYAVINDIAVVSRDTIFVVTDSFSLWKIANASARTRTWERILTANTVTIPANALTNLNPLLSNIALVSTSPDFLTDGVVYATDNAVGIMKAIDGGSVFAPMGPIPAGAINVLLVLDATFAFIGSAGQVYRTDDGGYSWLAAITPPVGTVTDIALAPNYDTSGHMLVGCSTGFSPAGGVFMSEDGGATFAAMSGPPPITAAGNKYVAFEPTYTGSGHPGPASYGIYAAGGGVIVRYYAAGVFWESIDATIPTGVAGASVFSYTATGPVTVSIISDADGDISIVGTLITLPDATDAVAITNTDIVANTVTVTATSGTQTSVPASPAVLAATASMTVTFLTGGAGAGASAINGLLESPDGTLYGCNALAGQGVERSLNPTASAPSAFLTGPVEGVMVPVFERMNQTLAATATLMALQLVIDDTLVVDGSKNVLFAINTTGSMGVAAIVTYTDTLAIEVVATSPESGAIFPRVTDVTLEWEELTGALGYRYEIARDDAFRLIGAAGDTFYPTAMVTGLLAGQEYYWRVRVDSAPAGAPGLPVLSRWSETRTFTTELGGRIWHPFVPIAGVAPGPGAQDVLTKPVFQWNGADWATSYELVLADNAAFTGATTKTLTTTSWVSDTDLGYSTTWYWKVRALSAASESEWSDVGVFTTMAEPVEATPPVVIQEVPDIIVEVPPVEVPPAVEATPTWALLVIIIIGAVLVVSVIVLILRTRRPI